MQSQRGKWLLLGVGAAVAAGSVAAKLYLARQFRSEAALLTRTLDLAPGMVVADVGAGDGKMAAAMASKVGSRGRVYATEIDPKQIEKIRRTVERSQLQNVTVLPAGVDSTGLPENCCDAIFLRSVYHHLTRPDDYDKSLWQALRPGGRLLVSEIVLRDEDGQGRIGATCGLTLEDWFR